MNQSTFYLYLGGGLIIWTFLFKSTSSTSDFDDTLENVTTSMITSYTLGENVIVGGIITPEKMMEIELKATSAYIYSLSEEEMAHTIKAIDERLFILEKESIDESLTRSRHL